ncbi:sialate O-acetylesterase [Pseudochryseolinea flava]|uniref:9-O-acetylesterase n=1 Tax=Pseudochryseolinea flava TaxID=2059302 RepID=A0A364XXW2_9BACT|nr:sialate O-acetylesterase [Pseudochryseolinea flava]RAV99250.1 9-O-acetylesterase [Pseudochryseolinea flava]
MKRFSFLLFLTTLTLSVSSFAKVTLPQIFTDNMVLQRDKAVKVWGWADAGENVSVSFNGQTVKVKTDKSGHWIVSLKPMAFGGPFEMKIAGKANNVSLKNVLIGDVWICSGQSNMEWTIKNTNNSAKEVAEANYPNIRFFTVEKAVSYKPKEDVTGQWLVCSPQTLADFSAVAYFFGRKLNKDLNVPIGLISTSWGGTNIQTWISWDVMSKDEAYKDITPEAFEKMASQQHEKQAQYKAALLNEKGVAEKWFDSNYKASDWKTVELPKAWEQTSIGNTDGIIWFKKDFQATADMIAKNATLSLGPIDDEDVTYVNGKQIGREVEWNKDRRYEVPAGTLVAGTNTITIKVIDNQGGGGLHGKPEQLFVDIDGKTISLAGEWKYKESVTTSQYGVKFIGPNEFPSQLYNAMVAPLISYSIKGAIWYQGEANTYQAYRYRTLLPTLINDWRKHWNDSFAFYWVQLANFMEPSATPVDSDWAELREAQDMTLSVPNTGQAVIIDIGEAFDIHPRNKQDVGYRLALAALKNSYNKNIVYSGPRYQSMKVEGNKIILSFSEKGSGLKTKDKYGYVRGFAIAGADKKFVWAKASIEGDNIVVYSDKVANPVAVRYAWGNNPDDANLYNNEDLPAAPFRTDQWKGVTEGR